MKFTGDISQVQINQQTVIDYALMNDHTYYPSPLLSFGSQGYTKHYFVESQRVMSRTGDYFDQEAALIPLFNEPGTIDMNEKAIQIETQLEDHFECFGLGGEYSYSIDWPWLEAEGEPALYWYHNDHLGSSSFISDATGQPTQHLEYLPFGELFIEERDSWNTPYKFSGKELDDETGYSYFGARYYDPNISIWLSVYIERSRDVDPLSDKYPSHSPYNYTLNNPVMFVDPDGRYTWLGAKWRQARDGGSKLYKIGNDWAYNIQIKDNNGTPVDYATKVGSKVHRSKNWGGINWFTRSGAGGEQETRKTFSDVVSEKIDLLLQTLGISGGAKNPSKGAGNLGEEIINAAKDINNVQKAYEGLNKLGDELNPSTERIKDQADSKQMDVYYYSSPETKNVRNCNPFIKENEHNREVLRGRGTSDNPVSRETMDSLKYD